MDYVKVSVVERPSIKQMKMNGTMAQRSWILGTRSENCLFIKNTKNWENSIDRLLSTRATGAMEWGGGGGDFGRTLVRYRLQKSSRIDRWCRYETSNTLRRRPGRFARAERGPRRCLFPTGSAASGRPLEKNCDTGNVRYENFLIVNYVICEAGLNLLALTAKFNNIARPSR